MMWNWRLSRAAARLAVRHQGHTGMTVPFDPRYPPPRVLRAVQRVLDALSSKKDVSAEKMAARPVCCRITAARGRRPTRS